MKGLAGGTDGQSTLEYALVLFALLASIAALGTVLTVLRDPSSFEAVVATSAHTLGGADPIGAAQDLVVF